MQFWCVVKQTPLSISGDGVLSFKTFPGCRSEKPVHCYNRQFQVNECALQLIVLTQCPANHKSLAAASYSR